MANYGPAVGSGRISRPDPISHIGPTFQPATSDPLALMPNGCVAVSGALVRIEGVRILRHGAGWLAVGLRLRNNDPASTICEVFLHAGDGRDLVIAVIDEDDAIACWRSAGNATALPLMIQAADGSQSHPYPQIGPVALGQFHFRRQHSFLRHRRPRFLVRRKSTRLTFAAEQIKGLELSRGNVR